MPYEPGLYEQTEADLIGQLSPLSELAVIVALGENEDDFKNPTTKPRITIGYRESIFDTKGSTGINTGKEVLNFDVIIQARKLRGPAGVYDLLQLVKQLFNGFRPTLTDPVSMQTTYFVDHEQNVWIYRTQIECESVTVSDQNIEPKDLADRLLLVTAENEIAGNVTVESETP